MNERIKTIVEDCGFYVDYDNRAVTNKEIEFLAQQIAKDCYNSCMKLAETRFCYREYGVLNRGGTALAELAGLIREDYDL